MISEISGFVYFPKVAVSWRITAFPKMPCWNPYLYSVFWVCAFWAKLSKKQFLNTPPKRKRKFWLITENLFFGLFVFFLFLSFFSFWFFFVFWGVLFFLCFFAGFKGQVRCPEGPPHLALNPPYFFCLVFFVFLFFPFFASKRHKPCFSPRKGHFWFIFECLPFFLLSPFWPPLFQFLFLCLSLVLFFLFSFLSFFFAFSLSFFPFLS